MILPRGLLKPRGELALRLVLELPGAPGRSPTDPKYPILIETFLGVSPDPGRL